MSCKDAMVKKVATVKQSDTVEKALGLLKKEASGIVPVLDDESGMVKGVFSRRQLLKEIMPVSVGIPSSGNREGFDTPVTISGAMLGAAPGLSKRLEKLLPRGVTTIAYGPFQTVRPDTPLWEGLKRIMETGESVPVIGEDGALEGVISETSLLAALEKAK
jgi:CBS-domain-containing membrane protein